MWRCREGSGWDERTCLGGGGVGGKEWFNNDNSDKTNDANDDERISAETTASEGI